MRLFANERLAGTAKTLLAQSSVPVMANSFMVYSDFMYDASDISAQPLTSLATTYWRSGTGQLFMRASWTPDAAYANFICGPYTESHAQNGWMLHPRLAPRKPGLQLLLVSALQPLRDAVVACLFIQTLV